MNVNAYFTGAKASHRLQMMDAVSKELRKTSDTLVAGLFPMLLPDETLSVESSNLKLFAQFWRQMEGLETRCEEISASEDDIRLIEERSSIMDQAFRLARMGGMVTSEGYKLLSKKCSEIQELEAQMPGTHLMVIMVDMEPVVNGVFGMDSLAGLPVLPGFQGHAILVPSTSIEDMAPFIAHTIIRTCWRMRREIKSRDSEDCEDDESVSKEPAPPTPTED